jgi:c-di-GMP-binding flagellar brake protein YcgR
MSSTPTSTQSTSTTTTPVEEKKKVEFLSFDKSQMWTLVSNDEREFVVDIRCMLYSGVIKSMVNGPFMESTDKRIEFDQISGATLEKVIQYCYYKQRFDFDPQNRKEFPIDGDAAFLLMLAAQYLEL